MAVYSKYKVLNIAGDIGEALLKNGSEIYRLETNVCGAVKHFGFECNCFATLTCLIVGIEDENGETITIVRRISSRQTNLDKVYKIITLVENIDKYTMDEIKSAIQNIDKEETYTEYQILLAYCIVAGFFSTLFGGGSRDFLVAVVGGLSIGIFNKFCELIDVGSFFVNLICGFIATAVGALSQKYGFIPDMSIPIISALMILVPGVPFVNSMRDIFSDDLVTGISRFIEVIMIGTSIAVGSGIALKLFM